MDLVELSPMGVTMENLQWLDEEDDWHVLMKFLPMGWQTEARDLGALKRCRKFENAETLLRTLFIHLASGCSLRETVVRARQGNITSISDVVKDQGISPDPGSRQIPTSPAPRW